MDLSNTKKVVFSEEALKNRVNVLGHQITDDYSGKEIILVGVLKGAIFFLCDLARAINLPVQIDLISIGAHSNIPGKKGVMQITKDLDYDIAGKHVLIIEDIIRSGLTTGFVIQILQKREPASIKLCTLLLCQEEQLINLPIAYVGFEIPKARLKGYGLDVDENGRNTPYIEEIV